MKIALYTFCVLGLAYVCAGANIPNHERSTDQPQANVSKTERGSISWVPCDQSITNSTVFQCGRLTAPLDYTNPNDERNASIFIVKYPAGGGKTPASRKLGSILINPGGPGGSGVQFITEHPSSFGHHTGAETLDRLFKGTYDIVSFDPRGVGLTVPNAECFDTQGNVLFTIQSNDYGVARDHGKQGADFEYGNLLAGYKLQAELCASNPERKDLFRFMSTPIAARDMRLLHQALGDNYWGFSYGTVLGSVYADMFPQDSRRVVIDGVMDAPNYLSGEATNGLADADATFDHFLSECVQTGPSRCALAQLASTSDELRTKFFDFADNLKVNPMPAIKVALPQLLTHNMLILNLYMSLYTTSNWSYMSDLITAAMKGDANPFVDVFGASTTLSSAQQLNQALLAISCGDALIDPPSQPWTWKDVANLQAKIDKYTKYFGPLLNGNGGPCLSSWPIRSVERHHGKFDSHTNFTLLAIGNDFDPITPGEYADLMAKRFPNAVSIRRAGYGHSSTSQPSKCVMKIVRDYFVEGKVPKKGTYCQVDKPALTDHKKNKVVEHNDI